MKRLLLMLALLCGVASGQSLTGSITATGATCATTAACVDLQMPSGDAGSATILVTGTWVATLQFEASVDGITYAAINFTPPNSTSPVTSATANGTWQGNVAGYKNVRVRCSAFTSGTAVVTINSSKGMAKVGGGGAVFASGGTTANVIPKSNGSSLLVDSPLLAADANTVQQSNTTTAQTFYVYNTTDSNATPVNYERLALTFVANAPRIAVQKGGTGSARGLEVQLAAAQAMKFLDSGGSNRMQVAGDTGTINFYKSISTAGIGVVPVYGATSQKAETTTADANVLTYTPPATAGSYRVNVAISVASATSGVISYTVSWTDSNGNAQSNIAGPLFQFGTAAPNTTFTTSVAGNYSGSMNIDVNNAAAAIIVKWVGGGTTSAKMSAAIEQIQ